MYVKTKYKIAIKAKNAIFASEALTKNQKAAAIGSE